MSFFINRFRNSRSSVLDSELNEIQTPTIPVKEENNYFIEAIRRNDLDAVKEFLDGKLADINCIDRTGRTGLQIAVQEKNISMLAELLARGADIGNALLDAIKIESLECVAILVQYDIGRRDHTVKRQRSRQSLKAQTNLRNTVLSPLVLAAQLENFEITKYLMTNGYVIEKPHAKFCSCDNCKALGRLGCYINHLNIYRAMVSPVYIALAFLLQNPHDTSKNLDPIYRAFVLKREILEHADIEFEFREDYLKLAEKCEEFAVALLNQCSDLDEISLFMTMPALKGDCGIDVLGGSSHQTAQLSVLNFAIKYSNTKFIAHRYSQVLLNSVIYHGLQGFEEHNLFINGVVIFTYWVFMPFFMLMYQCLPTFFWTRWLEVPMVKYLSHVGSMIWFVCILIAAAFQDKLPNSEYLRISVVDVLVGLWVIGIFVEEVKQFKRQGKERYTSQWWHLCTLVVVLFFLLTGILWLTAYATLALEHDSNLVPFKVILESTNITPRTLLLLSHSFYAAALIVTFFQASYHFQVSYVFGPLHLSMMKMVGDVLKFFTLFCVAYFAFCIGLRKLYSQYVQTVNAPPVPSSGKNVAPSNGTSQNVNHEFQGAEGTFSHLFWALFGLTDAQLFNTREGFEITRIVGNIIFAAYLVTALVALNLLIAMLTNTFHKVSIHQDVIFKVARTRILMQYVNRGSVASAPFNLLPFKATARYIYSWCTTCAMPNFNENVLRYNEEMRNRVMRLLIQRYFMDKDEDEILPHDLLATGLQPNPKQSSSL